jgi:predicted nucleotidyltransferase
MTSILGTIKDAVGPDDGILALWIYGSAARGDDTADSDLDIAIIAKKAMPTVSSEEMHAKITQAGERLAFRPSILELTAADVLRLAEENDPWWVSVSRDALVIKGLRPADLVKAVRRKGVAAA